MTDSEADELRREVADMRERIDSLSQFNAEAALTHMRKSLRSWRGNVDADDLCCLLIDAIDAGRGAK